MEKRFAMPAGRGQGQNGMDHDESSRHASQVHAGKDTPSASSAVVETVYRKPREFVDVHELEEGLRRIDRVPTAVGFHSFDSTQEIEALGSRYEVEVDSVTNTFDLDWVVDRIPDMRRPTYSQDHEISEREPPEVVEAKLDEEEEHPDIGRYATLTKDGTYFSEDSDSCPAMWVNESQEDQMLHEKNYSEALEEAKRLKELNDVQSDDNIVTETTRDSEGRKALKGRKEPERKKTSGELVHAETVKSSEERIQRRLPLKTQSAKESTSTSLKTQEIKRAAGWSRWMPLVRRSHRAQQVGCPSSESNKKTSRSESPKPDNSTESNSLVEGSSNREVSHVIPEPTNIEGTNLGVVESKPPNTQRAPVDLDIPTSDSSKHSMTGTKTSRIRANLSMEGCLTRESNSKSSDAKSQASKATATSLESRETLRQKSLFDTEESCRLVPRNGSAISLSSKIPTSHDATQEVAPPDSILDLHLHQNNTEENKSSKSKRSVPTVQSAPVSVNSRGRSVVTEPPARKYDRQLHDDNISEGSPVKISSSFLREVAQRKQTFKEKFSDSSRSIPTVQSGPVSVNSRGRSVATEPPARKYDQLLLDDNKSQGSPVKISSSFLNEVARKKQGIAENSSSSSRSNPTVQSRPVSVNSRSRSVVTEPPARTYDQQLQDDNKSHGSPVKMRPSFLREVAENKHTGKHPTRSTSQPVLDDPPVSSQSLSGSSVVHLDPEGYPHQRQEYFNERHMAHTVKDVGANVVEKLSSGMPVSSQSHCTVADTYNNEGDSYVSSVHQVSNDTVRAVRGEKKVVKEDKVAKNIDGLTSWIIAGFDSLASIGLKAPIRFLDWSGEETQIRKIQSASVLAPGEKCVHNQNNHGVLISHKSAALTNHDAQTSKSSDSGLVSEAKHHDEETADVKVREIRPHSRSRGAIGMSGLVQKKVQSTQRASLACNKQHHQPSEEEPGHTLGIKSIKLQTGVEVQVPDEMEKQINERNQHVLQRLRRIPHGNISISSIEIPTPIRGRSEDEYSASVLGLEKEKSFRKEHEENSPPTPSAHSVKKYASDIGQKRSMKENSTPTASAHAVKKHASDIGQKRSMKTDRKDRKLQQPPPQRRHPSILDVHQKSAKQSQRQRSKSPHHGKLRPKPCGADNDVHRIKDRVRSQAARTKVQKKKKPFSIFGRK